MKRWLIVWFVLVLVACNGIGGEDELASLPTEAAVVVEPTAILSAPAGATATQLPPPVEINLTETATPIVVASEVPAGAITASPTATAIPPTEVPMINGQNSDGTFFRGLSNDPIAMTDYSDFL